jgi:hypothetical protein
MSSFLADERRIQFVRNQTDLRFFLFQRYPDSTAAICCAG